jgi:hypothetical protein
MNDRLDALMAERFAAFIEPYLSAPGDGFAFELKEAHTKRVVDLARRICDEEGIGGDARTATILAAQLHDLGRFPQYRKYHTFRDADSANHAALSVMHALRANMLDGVPLPIRRTIIGAVYLHNKRLLPADLPADMDTAARVVRDSDKLDIFQVMLSFFAEEQHEHPEVALSAQNEPEKYSPDVLRTLIAREPGDYAKIVYYNDFKLMSVGWLYDLNFRSSCRILKQRKYLEALFAILPDDPAMGRARAQVMADLANRAGDA